MRSHRTVIPTNAGMTVKQFVIQISPRTIALLDELEFPVSVPLFDLFSRVIAPSIVSCCRTRPGYAPIFLGEASQKVILVLITLFRHVAGDADRVSPIALAGEDVDTGLLSQVCRPSLPREWNPGCSYDLFKCNQPYDLDSACAGMTTGNALSLFISPTSSEPFCACSMALAASAACSSRRAWRALSGGELGRRCQPAFRHHAFAFLEQVGKDALVDTFMDLAVSVTTKCA